MSPPTFYPSRPHSSRTSLYEHPHIPALTPPKSLPSLLSLLLYPQSQWMISFSSLLALILWLFDDNLSCPRGYLSRISGTLDVSPEQRTTKGHYKGDT